MALYITLTLIQLSLTTVATGTIHLSLRSDDLINNKTVRENTGLRSYYNKVFYRGNDTRTEAVALKISFVLFPFRSIKRTLTNSKSRSSVTEETLRIPRSPVIPLSLVLEPA